MGGLAKLPHRNQGDGDAAQAGILPNGETPRLVEFQMGVGAVAARQSPKNLQPLRSKGAGSFRGEFSTPNQKGGNVQTWLVFGGEQVSRKWLSI